MIRIAAAVVAAGAFGVAAVLTAGPAPAESGAANCETVPWGFFGSQRRTICDGPQRPGGDWIRKRAIWTPAHQVPFTCNYGSYFSSCTGGYFVDEQVNDFETYPVTPETVLPDEPGHLPT